ncbi:hypothetical protein KGM_208847 [Danaus plexippus plexippus]|uniref:tRNA N(3)-methylcytidine methyltransferase n=1 Tax=Danaus plexippus plexippus TaxID=278856 RepID=A0A212FB83_DANPL|nr:hypothetical protein KGM_208847 [Danaus plexippus plexippus]
MITEARAARLEREAKRHWDIFYKRNETKFFKDRHWTTREFQELINFDVDQKIVYLEMGCGVGNMVFPLIEEGFSNFYFYACDFSPRAVEFVKSNKLYDENKIKAFCADLTTDDLYNNVEKESVDICSLIFVLSAIHPACWSQVAKLAYNVLRPGGVLLFRDYGRYDMAQLRFKPGHKISENFYMRQDGTRSYFFTDNELAHLFVGAGFEIHMNDYVQRRTVNFKEGIDVPRIFVQGKYKKPVADDLGLERFETVYEGELSGINHFTTCKTQYKEYNYPFCLPVPLSQLRE